MMQVDGKAADDDDDDDDNDRADTTRRYCITSKGGPALSADMNDCPKAVAQNRSEYDRQ